MIVIDYIGSIAIFLGLFSSVLFLITFLEQRSELKTPPITKYYTVGILIPAYNEEKTIEKTVRSVLDLDYPADKLNVVVIDDGSKDKTYEIAKRFEKEGVIVYTKENGGKASALNYAIERSKADIVFSLDADSFVERDTLKRMIGHFDNPDLMAVTPALKIYGKGNWIQKIQKVEYLWCIFLRKTFAMLGSIHVTPGPFTGYRKIFFDRYGGYDENNLTEDIEIALRIQSKNYVIENCMDANVHTIGPNTFMGLFRQRLRWYKGFLDNITKYNHLFSYRYGNLGLFILPSNFIFIFLLLSITLVIIYNLIFHAYYFLLNLGAVNFDILSLFTFDTFNVYTPPFFSMALLLLILSYLVIILAKKISNDSSKMKAAYALYVILYWNLLAFWWAMAIIYKVFNIDIRWGR